MRVPLDESHVGDGVGGVLEAAALEDAGEAVAEVEVGGRDGAAEGELEEGNFPISSRNFESRGTLRAT